MRSENTLLLEYNYHAPPCTENNAIVTANWLSFRYDIIIIVIILVITFKHGIYNYIPETNHVTAVYSVATVLYLQFVLNVMLLSMLNMLCTLTLGTAVAQWLRYCATNQKVAGSIPDGVMGYFIDINPSERTIALGSTQPLTEMSSRCISWG
jgi:hypothetical protein